MHTPNGAGPKPGGQDRYALRVIRLLPGEVCLFRMLSEAYVGLLTHWVGGRGQYCPGANACPRSLHQRAGIWKGYAAAELWCPIRKLWFPCVPELTEFAELDLRGRYARGQTWSFSREKRQGEVNPRLEAALTEVNDPSSMPRAFDVRPIVATLYHVAEVRLEVENPMPPKVLAEPSAGPSPAGKDGAAEDGPAGKEQVKKMLDAWKRRGQLNGGGK